MCNKLRLAVIVGLWSIQLGSTGAGATESLLWEAPHAGSFALSPLGGWSAGNRMDGPIVGIRGTFVFENFLGGLNGQAIFIDSGAIYAFGLDFLGRYGPVYAGAGLSGHYFPVRSGIPIWAMVFSAGVHLPTPFSGVFLDLSYRPAVFLSETRYGVYHTFLLGLLFET